MSTNFLNNFKISFLVAITLMRRNSGRVFLLLLSLLAVIFLQVKFNFINLGPNIVTEGFVGTFQEHDLPPEVTRLASQGLVDIDEAGRVIPSLAEFEVNKEATQYKFKLRDGVKWINGEQIKSSDLEFSIPNTSISFPDDKTIEFKLPESYSAFPSLLTRAVFKKGTMMGTGPYKIQSIEKSRIFITKVVLDTPNSNFPKVVIRFYPNEKTAMTGFMLGETQSLLGVSNSLIASSGELNIPIVKLTTRVDFTKIVDVFYDTTDPVLSNRSLRQALSFAAPQIRGEVEANNPYPPTSWALFKDAKDYLDNPEEADLAMNRAKSNSSAELLSKELVLTTTSQLEEVGKEVTSKWRDLGINAVLRVESGIPQKFQALLITQSIPADPDQYFLWHETQKETNLTKYNQKRVDKDLEDARKVTSEEERKELYWDFQKVLLEDAPATFLYFPKYNILYLKKAEKALNQILPLQFSQLVKP